MLFQHLSDAIGVTGPVLLILLLGIVLRRRGVIGEAFIATGDKLVFTVTLPLMLFFSLATRDPSEILRPGLALFAVFSVFSSIALLYWLAPRFVEAEKLPVFIQGAFRGNLGIVGLALLISAYGSEVIAQAASYLAVVILLFNITSVWILGKRGDAHWLRMLGNPLIIGIVTGALVALLQIPIPKLLLDSGRYLSQMSLPLALLCIGGSLNWQSFRGNHRDVLRASVFKLVLQPVLITAAAWAIGYRGEVLGIVYLLMASPTAAASYVMARQMTNHGPMAAEIVALTTALSPFTITLGLVVLASLGLY